MSACHLTRRIEVKNSRPLVKVRMAIFNFGKVNKMSYLIKDTTKEEREKIVRDSLGNIEANCDGCMSGLAEMYQDYIDGKKELRDINMEFNARYVKADNDDEYRMSCGM